MKKLILSLAMLVGANSVLPLAASAESMYQDIMGSIVNASLVKNDQERFFALCAALNDVKGLKNSAERNLIHSHDENALRMAYRFLGSVSASLGAFILLIQNPNRTIFEHLAAAGYFGSIAVGCFAQQQMKGYFLKKNLAELNEVIAKLETAKAELENKIAAEQQELNATAIEQQV